MYSNIKVAFEVNLSSEGEMDANYVNITYALYFVWLNNAAAVETSLLFHLNFYSKIRL